MHLLQGVWLCTSRGDKRRQHGFEVQSIKDIDKQWRSLFKGMLSEEFSPMAFFPNEVSLCHLKGVCHNLICSLFKTIFFLYFLWFEPILAPDKQFLIFEHKDKINLTPRCARYWEVKNFRLNMNFDTFPTIIAVFTKKRILFLCPSTVRANRDQQSFLLLLPSVQFDSAVWCTLLSFS